MEESLLRRSWQTQNRINCITLTLSFQVLLKYEFCKYNNKNNTSRKTRPLANKKENVSSSEFCNCSGSQSKNKKDEKIDKSLDLAWLLKKAVENVGDGDNNCTWCV